MLTDDEVAAYRREGFVILPGLLASTEVDEWRSLVATAVSRRSECPPGGRLGVLDGGSRANELFLQHVNLWQTDPGIQQIILRSALGAIFAQLEGVPTVRLCFDSLLMKRPFALPSRFHLDLPHWSVRSNHAATIWVALDDVDATNGCMCYLSGTHRDPRTEPVDAPQGFRALFERYPDWAKLTPVFCPVSAGDAVAHHALTAHGSTANMGPHWRRSMTVAFVADGATFTGHRSPLFAVPDSTAPGDPLRDDDEHPIVFRRDDSPAVHGIRS
jgi:hypothetical protein